MNSHWNLMSSYRLLGIPMGIWWIPIGIPWTHILIQWIHIGILWISIGIPCDSPGGRKRGKVQRAKLWGCLVRFAQKHMTDPRVIIFILVFARDSPCGRKTIPRFFFAKKNAFGSARARDSEGKHKKDQRMIILHWFLRGIRHVAEKGSIFIAIRPVGALGPVRRRTAPYGHTGSQSKGFLGRAREIIYIEWSVEGEGEGEGEGKIGLASGLISISPPPAQPFSYRVFFATAFYWIRKPVSFSM